MVILISILSAIFLLAAFVGNTPYAITNPFISYLFFVLDFLIEHVFLFLICSCAVLFFFIRQEYRHTRHITYTYALLQTLFLCVASIFFTFVGLLLIAFIHLNAYALILNTNPSLLGVNTKTTSIVKTLQQETTPPTIIPTDSASQESVRAVAVASAGTTNLYGNTILAAIPRFLILPVKKISSSLMLTDNTLIVSSLNLSDLQAISPTLGYLFVQEYFPNRQIKRYPKISVMTKSQFITYQKKNAKGKESTVTTDIQNMEDSISSLSAIIKEDTNAITTIQNQTDTSLKQQNHDYDTCLSTGQYNNGIFVPTYSKSYCQTILDTWQTTLTKEGKDENTANVTLQKDQQLVKDYQYYDNFFKAQQTLMTITEGTIGSELGVFEAPNAIRIIIPTQNTHTISDFFETLSHEYLHYASTVNGKRFDSSFFEEGLTEYFARKTIEDTMQIRTNIAYSAQVTIITALTKRIAEADLADIYFSKDEVALENKLNLAYGDNFYKDNYVYFETLMYTTDPTQELQLTNKILSHMGEKPLTEKDLFGSN